LDALKWRYLLAKNHDGPLTIFFFNELTGFSNFFLDRSQDIIGLLAWSGVTAELSKSSALSMEEAVNYTDMSLGVATVRTGRTGSR